MKDVVKVCAIYFALGVGTITGVSLGFNIAKVIDKKFDEKLEKKEDSIKERDWA